MKNIYKISILLVAFLAFASCAIDDDPAVVSNTNKIEASLENPVVRIDANATDYDLVVNLSGILVKTGQLSYWLDGVSGTIQGDAGASSITIPVDMSNSTARTVVLDDLIILYASADGSSSSISTMKKTTIVKGDDVVFTFTWDDDSDLDCGTIFRDNTGTYGVDVSAGLSQPEVCVLPNAVPDGTYNFAILPWTVNNSNIACTVEVVNGLEVKTYKANLIDGVPAGFFGYNQIEDFLKLEKTGNDVTVTQVLN